jgi:fermentation-respiration switch protein FrsA (DUF1100 family)
LSLLKWLLIAAAGYGAVVALMYVAQRSLMYFPERLRTPPAEAGFPQVEELTLETSDGERIVAWHVAPRPGKPLAIYFHGNGGSLRYRASRFAALVSDGTGLLAVSYRGYGGSSGSPSESGLIADAQAAYAFAAKRHPGQPIVLWGESLGSGVALALAAGQQVSAVILEAPFTSAADVGAAAYPFVPVRWLIKDSFRSDRRIGNVNAPVLVMHGERDNVVPIGFGERLFALANEPKKFVRFPRGGHNDLDAHGATEAARAFLGGQFR